MKKIRYSFSSLPVSTFLVHTVMICSKLSDTIFKAIVPQPKEVMTKIHALSDLQQQVMAGNFGMIAGRNALRKEIENMLSRQGEWVNSFANGKLEILEKSGFPLVKARSPKPVPAKISKLTVSRGGDSGEVTVNYSAADRIYYELQATQNNSVEKTFATVAQPTKTKYTVADLPVGQYTYFRIRAVNTTGKGEWSEVVRIMVG